MSLLTTGTESTTQIYEILHDKYIKGVFDQFPKDAFLIDRFQKMKVDGRQYIIKNRIGSNRTAAAVAERGALPSAKGRLFKEMSDNTKYVYAPFDITGPEIHESKGPGQFIDVVADAFKDTYQAFLDSNNRIMWGNGSGRIAQSSGTGSYSATTGLTTVTIDGGSPYLLFEYETINFGTDTSDYEIKVIDYENNYVYVGGDASGDATDNVWIYHDGDYTATLDRNPIGIDGHVDSGNLPSGEYQGIDRTATGYEWAQAYELDQSGAAMTTLEFKQFLDVIRARNAGKTPDLLITEPGVENSFMLLMEAKHQNFPPMVREIGADSPLAYRFNGKKFDLMVSDQCLPGSLYAINTDFIKIYESRPISWDTTMGSGKVERKSGYDIYEGFIAWYYNIASPMPKAHGKWVDIKRNSIT